MTPVAVGPGYECGLFVAGEVIGSDRAAQHACAVVDEVTRFALRARRGKGGADVPAGRGQRIGRVVLATPEVFAAAANAAAAAWGGGLGPWPAAEPSERSAAVLGFAAALERRKVEITRFLELEIYKSARDAAVEVERTIAYMRDTVQLYGERIRAGAEPRRVGALAVETRLSGVGPVLCLGPFNYPFNETLSLVAPALLAGNPVVVKTSRYGRLFWGLVYDELRSLFPPGALNILHGEGRALIAQGINTGVFEAMAYVGSSKAADHILRSHPAPHRLKVLLGLDAKNAAVVLADADVRKAALECAKGGLTYNGQRCTAIKAILVDRTIAPAFEAALVEEVSKLKAGMPWDEGVTITPLIDRGAAKAVVDLLEDALGHGAEVLYCKGGVLPDYARVSSLDFDGIIEPILLRKVPAAARIAREEQFGPLSPIMEVDSIDEVLGYLKALPFGMQVGVFTTDEAKHAHTIAQLTRLVGRVNVNSPCQRGPDTLPFTGKKSSAVGAMGLHDALSFFSAETLVVRPGA